MPLRVKKPSSTELDWDPACFEPGLADLIHDADFYALNLITCVMPSVRAEPRCWSCHRAVWHCKVYSMTPSTVLCVFVHAMPPNPCQADSWCSRSSARC